MAEDINKQIIIQVTAETGKLEQSITNLNKIIDSLQAKQQQLADTGQQTSASFQNNADKIEIYGKSLKDATTQLNSFKSALTEASGALQKNQSLIAALTTAKDKYSRSAGSSSAKVKELNTAIKTLSASVQQQQGRVKKSQSAIDGNTRSTSANAKQARKMQAGIKEVNTSLQQQKQTVNDNKEAFNAHKDVMDHLKTSFDEIKGISGEFGPSLQDVAQGFNAMKSGLEIMKGGIQGVGEALKTDGFDFLLQILQQIFSAFINSSEGTKILQGAISAIGVVVNDVKNFFNDFKNGIIDAVSHPIDTVKKLGQMIEQNIINRFKAFGVILDGIIHLDFKKIANGAIQAFTGVTDATDKIGTAFTAVKKGIEDTAGQMVTVYKKGYKQVGQEVGKHEENVKNSVDRQIGYYNKLQKKTKDVYENQTTNDTTDKSTSSASTTNNDTITENNDLEIAAENVTVINKTDNNQNQTGDTDKKTKNDQTAEAEKNEDEKKKEKEKNIELAARQHSDFEIQQTQKVSDAALSIIQKGIQRQTDARIAALEKQKTAELSNTSLTNTQRMAIEARYKKKEAQVKAKAFKQEQEASLAQAVINGALAITKATSQEGALAAFVVPGIIAETAIQVATIAAQKPPAYAKGGLHYASDGRGGLLSGYSRTDNTNAYLRSGEGIVVSEAMREPWARNLVSAINVGFGGRDFSVSNPGRGYAVGGIFTDGGDANRYYNAPVNDQKNLANTIAYQMVNNFPPVYVDVKDINNQQNILAQTINRVNL